MFSRVSKSISRLVALAFLVTVPIAAGAQATPAAKGPVDDSVSKWDIFIGYSYLAPSGTVQVPQSNGTIKPFNYNAVNFGMIGSVSYFFNRYLGVQAEVGVHEWGVEQPGKPIGTKGNNDGFTTVTGGLVLRYPQANLTPFAHADFGGAMVDGPDHNPFTWGPAVTVGGGLDYSTPWLHHRLAIRLFQADYEYMHADFGTGVGGGTASINAARLSAGVVFHTGGSVTPPPPVVMSCSANPTSVFPGDPVTVTATAGNLNPKLHTIYGWLGAGASGDSTTVNIATASLAPGTYTVNGSVKEGKPGKEGLKVGQSADCSAGFTVKAFEPPTISCSASPSTIKPGETSTVTASAVSPQNRPLTYSYNAAAGSITGSGTTATFSSTGAPTGSVGITCNVSDDKGHSANASTSVTITAPYVAPIPHTQALCSISFANDKKRPTRVDNEAKACLDEVALDLQKQSDAKAVVVGNSDAKEKAKLAKDQKLALKHKHMKVEDPAAERAINTKDYLVTEKGIDASRISVVSGTADDKKVEDYLVPSGATFTSDVTGTTPVDESAVKVQPRKPLAGKAAHKKAATKKAAAK